MQYARNYITGALRIFLNQPSQISIVRSLIKSHVHSHPELLEIHSGHQNLVTCNPLPLKQSSHKCQKRVSKLPGGSIKYHKQPTRIRDWKKEVYSQHRLQI